MGLSSYQSCEILRRAGLRYAFSRAMTRLERKYPRLAALHERISARPRIAA